MALPVIFPGSSSGLATATELNTALNLFIGYWNTDAQSDCGRINLDVKISKWAEVSLASQNPTNQQRVSFWKEGFHIDSNPTVEELTAKNHINVALVAHLFLAHLRLSDNSATIATDRGDYDVTTSRAINSTIWYSGVAATLAQNNMRIFSSLAQLVHGQEVPLDKTYLYPLPATITNFGSFIAANGEFCNLIVIYWNEKYIYGCIESYTAQAATTIKIWLGTIIGLHPFDLLNPTDRAMLYGIANPK